MMKKLLLSIAAILFVTGTSAQPLNNTKVNGYRGIWFTLGQEKEYGYKYSGGLGTYTVKHIPMAVYSPEVEKTFFVYGGTPSKKERHLLCMVGCFDHKTGLVQKPTVVYDKEEIKDPHDNPTVQLDKDGYIWVFISGRGDKREGHIYKSDRPYDIASFSHVKSWFMAYPQIHYIDGEGFFLNLTRYSGRRRLYWATSPDGVNWSEVKPLANIREEGDQHSGHYGVSNHYGKKMSIAFNRHKNGNVDTRTNIYYLETSDMGKTWTTADGKIVETPVTELYNPSLILDAQSKDKNVYIKDVNFDENGNSIILYLTSGGCEPGPDNAPFAWYVAHWTGKEWKHHYITNSSHNYDSGSLWTKGREWTVIAPTGDGPQRWQTGGEIVMWKSKNNGRSWKAVKELTSNSRYNHGYVRRPKAAADSFYGFWADGNPERLTQSKLYFTDSDGNVWELPYNMKEEWAAPIFYKKK